MCLYDSHQPYWVGLLLVCMHAFWFSSQAGCHRTLLQEGDVAPTAGDESQILWKADFVFQPVIWAEIDTDSQCLRAKVFWCGSFWRWLSYNRDFSLLFFPFYFSSFEESSWPVCVTCISSFIKSLGSYARWALGRNGEERLQRVNIVHCPWERQH